MKKLFITMMLVMVTITTWAYDVEVDGIYYKLNKTAKTACVTFKTLSSHLYSGDVAVPETITTAGVTYSVTSIGDYAFYSCSSLTSVTIPNTVTSIGYQAFYDCTSLTSITIPNSVTSIQSNTFSGCKGLTSVTIGNSVTSIGDYAFYSCSSLTSVTIPNSVTSIGEQSFMNCSGLTSLSIGDSAADIYSDAFYGCPSLESITVNSDNKVYDSRDNCNAIIEKSSNTLFAGCKNTVIPNSVTKIGDYAFNNCTGLTSVTIPNSITSIGQNAFVNCSNMKSVTIPNSVVSIGGMAFYGCKGLTSVTIPNSVASIGYNAFYQCSGLTSVVIPNSVTSIGSNAFSGCTGLTSVTIGNSVTSIGSYAFSECSSLASISCLATTPPTYGSNSFSSSVLSSVTLNVPSSAISAYQQADGWKEFANITAIPEIASGTTCDCTWTLDKYYNLTISGTGAMADYSSNSLAPWSAYQKKITSINICEGVTNIGRFAFYKCTGLTSIAIPNSVTNIDNCAFQNCSGLTSITFGNSLTRIGDGAFDSCTGLITVDIPNTVTSIGGGAFSGCIVLTSVTIPESVISVGSSAFKNTPWYSEYSNKDENIYGNIIYINNLAYQAISTSITSCEFKNNTIGISNAAFYECSGLNSVSIPNSVTSIGDMAFFQCSKLASVSIGNSVESIGSQVFQGCSDLTSVTVPNSVKCIGHFAFRDCTGLTTVTIGSSVDSIANYVFYQCLNIKSIYCLATTPPTYRSVFDSSVLTSATLNVPCSAVSAYQQATGWKDFTNISAITVKATSISLDKETASLKAGETAQLTATVLPEDATDKSVTWKSSDTNIATVSDAGLVTAVAEGTATITAKSTDGSGIEASCTITVTEESVSQNNSMGISPVSTNAGSQVVLPITMTNTAEIIGYQFDLKLPQGITIAKDEDEDPIIAVGPRTTSKKHGFSTIFVDDQTLRVVCTSQSNASFTGNDGVVCNITLNNAESLINGDYTVELRNVSLSDKESTDIACSDATGTITILNDYFTLTRVSGRSGSTFVLPVSMTNKSQITGFQFDVELPEGISVAKDDDDDFIITLGSRSTKHAFSSSVVNDNTVRFVCTSTSNAVFSGNEGVLCNVSLLPSKSIAAGTYDIKLKNISLSNANSLDIPVSDVSTTVDISTYTPGDVNNDTKISVADVTATISFILGTQLSNFIKEAADMDGNGIVKVNDATAVTALVLNGGVSKAREAISEFNSPYIEPAMYIEPLTIGDGEEKTLQISLDNVSDRITGAQFDLCLPSGISVVEDVEGAMTCLGERCCNHVAYSQKQPDNSYRFVVTSMNNSCFSGNAGTLLSIKVKASENISEGEYDIQLKNISLADDNTACIDLTDITNHITAIGSATGIDDIRQESADNTVYTLDGIKHNGHVNKNGLYIVNGKKTLIVK